MSYLSKSNQRNRYKRLLVFDTPALLSAQDQNPEQDWLNNQQLGDCYIPGGTFAEICELEKRGDIKAKKFLNFLQKWRSYEVLPIEDSKAIPIPNSVSRRDRQILACAFNLARAESDSVVVLITYDQIMQVLVTLRQVESLVPNFCTIPASALKWWFYNGRAQTPERLPDPVWNAQKRMKYFQRESRSLPSNAGKPKPLPLSPDTRQYHSPQPQVSQPTPTPAPQSESSSISRSQTSSINGWLIGFATVCVALFAVLLLGNITRRETAPQPKSEVTIIPQAAAANPQPIQPTPLTLIAEAEAAITRFQRTKDPSALRDPLNTLQTLKNQQGGRLDDSGEQALSRLKHRYAIQVLASSGQLAEAATMLRQIPQSYSEISTVREWLHDQNR